MSQPIPIAIADLQSEQAHDALLDALSLANLLLETPRTREELEVLYPASSGVDLDRHLRQLVRSGVIRLRDGRFEATSTAVAARRLGDQFGLLSEVFVPALMGIAFDSSESLLLQLELRLNLDEQKRLYEDHITTLYEELTRLANEDTEGTHERFVFVAAAPTVSYGEGGIDRALDIMRQAARDRAHPEKKPRAILSYFQGRFRLPARVMRSVMDFEKRMDAFRAPPTEATYSLVLGTGTRTGRSGDPR